jgi:hypothetical protein
MSPCVSFLRFLLTVSATSGASALLFPATGRRCGGRALIDNPPASPRFRLHYAHRPSPRPTVIPDAVLVDRVDDNNNNNVDDSALFDTPIHNLTIPELRTLVTALRQHRRDTVASPIASSTTTTSTATPEAEADADARRLASLPSDEAAHELTVPELRHQLARAQADQARAVAQVQQRAHDELTKLRDAHATAQRQSQTRVRVLEDTLRNATVARRNEQTAAKELVAQKQDEATRRVKAAEEQARHTMERMEIQFHNRLMQKDEQVQRVRDEIAQVRTTLAEKEREVEVLVEHTQSLRQNLKTTWGLVKLRLYQRFQQLRHTAAGHKPNGRFSVPKLDNSKSPFRDTPLSRH